MMHNAPAPRVEGPLFLIEIENPAMNCHEFAINIGDFAINMGHINGSRQ